MIDNILANEEDCEEQVLTYLSSFTYSGLEKDGNRLYIPHNGWQKELNWKEYTFEDLGFPVTQTKSIRRTSKTIEVYNTGNWSAKEYLPMGLLRNEVADTGLLWQIEHNGSWHYEIADQNDHYILNVSGPNEIQSHFCKNLKPQESFTSVPVAVVAVDANISNAFSTITSYRRKIRRANADNENLPVIFNDYMNCLWGDATTEKEIPLIDAAAKEGCEYFVIDAGWYDSGIWWDSVGECAWITLFCRDAAFSLRAIRRSMTSMHRYLLMPQLQWHRNRLQCGPIRLWMEIGKKRFLIWSIPCYCVYIRADIL